jgi:hypothetical protein
MAFRAVTGALTLLLFAGAAHAQFEASLDLRLVQSDGRDSFMDGGLGKLRFDAGDDSMRLGRARLAWRGGIGGDWHASVDLSAWSLEDHNRVDLTEALLEWRPVPDSAWRSKLKIGAFFPPVSLEHRAPGWSNPYTISSSALNTWVGEELRTIGMEYSIEHLGIAAGGRVDAGLQAALFGWNDPAGVVLAFRGFSMNDRQTPLFGRIGAFPLVGREQRVIFSEIDGRPGYYVAGHVKTDTGLELRAMRYNNRADRLEYKPSIADFGWNTHFDSLGMRYDAATGTTLVAQWMLGRTYASPYLSFCWNFRARFVLLSQQQGRFRFSARYDDFHVLQTTAHSPPPWGKDQGHGLTLGWTWAASEHIDVAAEWLRISSSNNLRSRLGESARAIEHSAQLSVKLYL